MCFLVLIWFSLIFAIYYDARARMTTTFPPGGWAFIVLILGPIGTTLYIFSTQSPVGIGVLVMQIAITIIWLIVNNLYA